MEKNLLKKKLFRILSYFGAGAILACGGGGGGSDVPVPAKFSTVTLIAGANFPVTAVTTPSGTLFYTELFSGQIRIVRGSILSPQPLITLDVAGSGNEGLIGLALDPAYANNGFLYVYRTVNSPTRNQVLRLHVVDDESVDEEKILLDNIPSGGHDGGRMAFDSSGHLLISTGDADNPENSQSLSSLGGKLLRIASDGTIPVDNPFGDSPIFALGFRNLFGLAVSPFNGAIYGSDNGPECDDEVNLIVAGSNYGWRPGQGCGDTTAGFEQAEVYFNPVIAPTGMFVYSGDLFPELRGKLLMGDFLTGGITVFNTDGSGGKVDGYLPLTNIGEPVIGLSQSENGEIVVLTPTRVLEIVK